MFYNNSDDDDVKISFFKCYMFKIVCKYVVITSYKHLGISYLSFFDMLYKKNYVKTFKICKAFANIFDDHL